MMEQHGPARARGARGRRRVVSRTMRCTGIGESRVAEILARPVRGLDEPDGRLPRVGRRGEGPAHRQGGHRGGGRRDDRADRRGGRAPARRRRLHRRRRVARGSRRPAPAGVGPTLACAESLTGGGVAERMSRGPGRVGGLRRRRRDVHRGGQAPGARRVAGDDRRTGRGERGVRARDGGRRPAPVRRRRRRVPDRCRRSRAARRRGAGNGVDRPGRRGCPPRASVTSRRGSASGCGGGRSRRRSTWCVATSRARRCPKAIASSDAAGPQAGRAVDRRTRGDAAGGCSSASRSRQAVADAIEASVRAMASGAPRGAMGAAREPARDDALPRVDRVRASSTGSRGARRGVAAAVAAPFDTRLARPRRPSRRRGGRACCGRA